jgi:hypothetical protein
LAEGCHLSRLQRQHSKYCPKALRSCLLLVLRQRSDIEQVTQVSQLWTWIWDQRSDGNCAHMKRFLTSFSELAEFLQQARQIYEERTDAPFHASTDTMLSRSRSYRSRHSARIGRIDTSQTPRWRRFCPSINPSRCSNMMGGCTWMCL